MYPLEIERTAFMQTHVRKCSRTAGTGTALLYRWHHQGLPEI